MTELGARANARAAGAGQTNTQRAVAAIWADVLKKSSFGAEDDFFEMGGNSMTASLVAYRLSDEFGHEFPLMLIFENSTVAEMAQAIDGIIAGGKNR